MADSPSDLLRLEHRLLHLSHYLCEAQVPDNDPSHLIVRYASPGLADAIGLRRGSNAVRQWRVYELLQLIHHDQRDEVTATIAEAMSRGTGCRLQCRLVPSAGDRRFDVLLEPGSPDEPGRWRAIVTDVTEWREIEGQLKAQHDRLMLATRAAHIGIWEADMLTGQSLYDEQMYDIYGLDKPAARGDEPLTALPGPGMQEWLQAVHPDDAAVCLEALERADRELVPVEYEHRIIRPSGEVRYVRSTALLITDAQGRRVRGVGTTVDVTDRKRLTRALAMEKERLELAMRAGNIGIWEVDLVNGTVSAWDDRLYTLYGMERGSALPTPDALLRAVHPDDAPRLQQEWHDAMSTGGLDTEFRVVRPSGATAYVRSLAQIFLSADGTPQRMVGVNWDSTAQRTLTDALTLAKERAEAAEQVKSDFLAVMSHEIRTPMNTVIGMTQLALQTDLTPRQRNYLDKIDVSARNLLGILNDILDFSKIEAGKMVLEETPFTLESVLESVAAVNTMKAEEKGLEIAFAVSPGVPDRLVGDPLRLGQVLINLVNNAIKFTELGEVVVAIDLEQPIVGDRVVLRCAVRDTGIGLSPDQIPGLFQAFSQAEQSVSRRYGGTGLGLAICRQLVELMGGRIWASGEPGHGSTFTFTFTAGVPRDVPMPAARRTAEPGLAGRRVLIVDDNASARQILRVMVETFGMQATAVSTGPVALRVLKEAAWRGGPFDLVLMDWRMPGMDGLETAERIKSDGDLRAMPAILMVTAYGREEVLKRTQQLGLNGVLIKPVTESTMFNTIADVLGCAHAGVRAALDEGPADRRGGARAAGNERWRALAGRRVLVVDDNALNREVVMEWLLSVDVKVDAAVNGRDALARLDSATYDAVLMDIHMPEMDGLTAAREIRKRPGLVNLPVVALTAQAQAIDREASLAAGMNAHLTKPIDGEQLYATLLDLLAPQIPPARPPSQVPDAQSGVHRLPATLPGIDLAAALEQLGGREALLQRLLRSFAGDFRDVPAALSGHYQAGRLEQIASIAHTVKSAAAYLGARALSEAASLLEDTVRHGRDDDLAERVIVFRGYLEAVLTSLDAFFARQTISAASGEAARQVPVDTAAVLSLVKSAEPLVARGDYGVAATLDEIGRLLAGSPIASLAESARGHFDELELEAASADLRRLRATLGGGVEV